MVVLTISGKALGAEAFEAWRERTSMLLLASHCQTLGELEQAALLSGQVQARGALLRAGKDPQSLDDILSDLASRAERVSCEREDVQAEISRMNEAAQVWSHMYSMRFPARWQNWEARRDDAREKPRWRVRVPLQDKAGNILDFGLVAQGENVFLGLTVMGGQVPSSVILQMRDSSRLAAPLDDDLLRLMGRKGDGPARLLPPKSVLQSFFAIDKSAAPASLTGEASKSGKINKAVMFRFAEKALDAFSALDPRDVVALELVFPARRGKRQRREYIYAEAGDFAAARLFAQTFPQEPDNAKTN